MFANAKLRLLMGLVGFERLGVEDVPGASWVIPSTLEADDMRETIAKINQTLINPIPEGSEEDPRTLLQRKETGSGRNSAVHETLDVNFGDDSEGEDTVPDGFLFPPNPRSKSNALDELKKKRKKKNKPDVETEPLDDEILEARRQARLSNALARQQKIKSDLFIHASDEESDADADEEFFRLEEMRRKAQAENIKNALLIGSVEKSTAKGKKKASVRKRKSDEGISAATGESKRQRRDSESAESSIHLDDDDDVLMADLEANSPVSKEKLDTLVSAEDEMDFDEDFAFSRDRVPKPSEPEPEPENDSDAEDTPVAPSRRRVRGGFVLDSDSE